MTDPWVLERVGAAVADRYHIERELGGGGMSHVLLAREGTLDRQVVIKVLSAEASAAVSVDRFRRETQLVAKLQHPNIVPVLAAGEADGLLYYVMPYVAGDSLRARLARDGALSVADTVGILREVLDALAFAHRHGVVHRDIKPENILLAAGHALVADFGVAKALRDSANLTGTGISIGTPSYMAPEQATADPLLDHRADLYAVGVVAYEMLTGAPLFTGSAQQVITAHITQQPSPLSERRPDVPAPLADAVMRSLEKSADRRPQSAEEFLRAIETGVTPGGADAPPVAATGIAAPSRKRKIGRQAIVIALIVATGLPLWRSSRPTMMGSAQAIAVVPFAAAANDTALVRLAHNLATLVGNNLDGMGEVRAADPTSVLSHALAKGASLTASDAIGIAKTVGAKSAVAGTLVRTGDLVRIDASMFDVLAPDAPVARVQVLASPDSLVAITDSLTIGLLRQIWSRGDPPTPHVAWITSHSPAALREFLNGERLFARGQVHEAGDAYKRAVYADTTFWFAALRYRFARSWSAEPIEDTAITGRLGRHRPELPERDRALLAAGDSSPSQTEYMRRLKAVTMRYPDYAPAWVTLADNSVHHFERSGYGVRDAIGEWREVQRLMPADFTTTDHIAFACIAAGDVACARTAADRLDALIRADASPSKYMLSTQKVLKLALAPMTPARLDSIIRAGLRDSTLLMIDRTGFVGMAPALVWQPGFLDYADSATRHVIAVAPKTVIGPNEIAGWLLTRAGRGDWTALDSAIRIRISETSNPNRTSPMDLVRARVVAELEGAMTPEAATVVGLAERAADPTRSVGTRAEARWLIGANALARGDSSTLRAQLAAFVGDTSAHTRIAARSLRALALGLGGNRAAAAESLLAVEREHGERGPKVWGAFAIDRLLGAQWLTEAKRYAPADSLLEFTRGYIIWTTASAALPVFGAAQLQRSRIAEAMGNREEAIRYATIFLRAYDLSPEKHHEAITEAQQRVSRLGGKKG